MKKFLISVVVIAALLLGSWYAIYFKGVYVSHFSQLEDKVIAEVKGKDIYINGKEFIIKGVDLPSHIAGHHATDYAIDYDTYQRWFRSMQDMGANAIRIYTIYNDTFYHAFYDYNINNENPLYLLQGIQVSDYANDSSQDAYGKDFYTSLKQDAKDVVDVVHGRKIISVNKMKGSGNYSLDISRWLLGYIVGNTWNAGTIQYTNHQYDYKQYIGEFFQTTSQANVFETLICQIMDQLMSYESDKYNQQSLITFTSSPETDPFEYTQDYARQLGKYTAINAEHIRPTVKLKSGYFASYQLYEFCDEFYQCFSSRQKEELESIYQQVDQSRYYHGYSELLQKYHTMPVVISGFGYSSSRGTESIKGPLNEQQQGEKLVETYQDIIESGCQGAFIDSWQDNWDKMTWNTSYSLMLNHIHRWHDIQSQSTSYGLIGFTSQQIKIDGRQDDWKDKQMIIDRKDLKVSLCGDEKGLYVFVEKNDLSSHQDIYIGLDISKQSGSYQYHNIKMDHGADFLVHIKGKQAEILVQSRYDALRENYLSQIQNKDPFEQIPSIHNAPFVAIKMICKNDKLTNPSMNDQELLETKKHPVYPTGLLKYGNQNDDSLSDYYMSNNALEMRIPWLLLNVSDPIDQLIHDDYYLHYGVEHIKAKDIAIGISFDSSTNMNLYTTQLPSLENLKYQGYYKKSYEIVKESWCQS